jgi:hypothetical protein
MEVSGQLHAPVASPLYPGTHYVGGWVDPRTILDVTEKRNKHLLSSPGIEPRMLGSPDCSLSAIKTELSRLPCCRVWHVFKLKVTTLLLSCSILTCHPAKWRQQRTNSCTIVTLTRESRKRWHSPLHGGEYHMMAILYRKCLIVGWYTMHYMILSVCEQRHFFYR